jgi:hypothetical protein
VSDEQNLEYDVERQPWDQMADETVHSYTAFMVYRDLGQSRSLRKAAEIFYEMDEPCPPDSTKLRQMKEWSTTRSWQMRVNAWDLTVEREESAERLQQAKDMKRRHAAVATVALSKAAERLRGLNPDNMTPSDAVRMLETGVKVERLSRGEPDQVRELTGPDGTSLEFNYSNELLEARIKALLEQEDVTNEPAGNSEENDA